MLPHSEPSLLPHVCLTVFVLGIATHGIQTFCINARLL